MPIILKQDPKAWQEGFDAGERGEPLRRCPYPAKGIDGWSWSSGYIEGKAKRQGYSYSDPLNVRGDRPEAITEGA